jgi:predicted DNA-binding protein (UPF0251 family)
MSTCEHKFEQSEREKIASHLLSSIIEMSFKLKNKIMLNKDEIEPCSLRKLIKNFQQKKTASKMKVFHRKKI